MHRVVKKMGKLLSLLKNTIAFDPQENAFFQYFKVLSKARDSSGPVVLVQRVKDPFYFGLFGQIASSLREQHLIRIHQYVMPNLNVGESKSIGLFIKVRLLDVLANWKWVRLYNSFCDGVGYSGTSFHPIGDAIDLRAAWNCWKNMSDRHALISLIINDVVVGDLVNDSYLRFKPAPTVDMKDFYLFILIWIAHRSVRRADNYFVRFKPKLYLTSYSTYIQHGIPVRIALKHNVSVYSFGNYQEFAKKLSIGDSVHTKNPDNYARDFFAMSEQEGKLNFAETGLRTRLSGGVDNATAYMKKSAYSETGAVVPDVSGGVVIFLHDFYDSPHVYREMVFPDFWEWVCFTIETLKSESIRFFIKPHPNQISLSDGVLNDLRRRYPDLPIISSDITNKQLAEAGMACAVTVYGTVAHEMAYLGVPSIASANHPHVSFAFCRTAKSRIEYAQLLRAYVDGGIDKMTMREQSLIFYYMHNLNVEPEQRSLLDFIMKLRLACAENKLTNSDWQKYMKDLAGLDGYKHHVSMWLSVFDDVSKGGLRHGIH